MEGKGNISDYRRKLDKTLASPDLTNDEMVHTLVKNQILRSLDSQLGEYTDYAVERRSKEVSNFLSELRSASVNDVERSKSSDESHSGWKALKACALKVQRTKGYFDMQNFSPVSLCLVFSMPVKQDTDEFRVMYREGPEGTLFHTLLAEGYVDGPLDVCLCISSESDLYKKWWPQITIPTFKVISSQCVQKVRMGEQISLVRMKVSWPMSSREALVHYFAFEYLQNDLVVVLLNSISDWENIDRSTHGFTRDGIPDAQDVVRMDLFGGFALLKVTADRSYFRTIANMDIKLDFVPPAIINFIARQLVGSGFKLYKKEVASVSKGDGKFREALKDPFYTRIHEALYSQNASKGSLALDNMRSTPIMLEEQSSEAFEDNSAKENNECDDYIIDSETKDVEVRDQKVLNEIEEFEEKDSEGSESLDEGTQKSCDNVGVREIEEFEEKDSEGSESLDECTQKSCDNVGVRDGKVLNEIEEFEEKDSEGSESSDEGTQKSCDNLTNEITEEVTTDKTEVVNSTEVERGHKITEHSGYDIKANVGISPEVQRALRTLEKAISIFREYNSNPGKGLSDVKKGNLLNLEDDAGEESISVEADGIRNENGTCVESSKIGSAELTSHAPRNSSDNHGSRHKGSNSYARETNQCKIAPASPDEDRSSPSHINHIDLHSSVNRKNVSIVSKSMTENHSLSADANTINGNRVTKRINKKSKFCCLSFISG